MKILLIQPTGDKRGHYGIYTTHVCQELARLGHSVTLFTNKTDPQKYISEKVLFTLEEYKTPRYAFSKFDEIKTKNPLVYHWGYLRNCFCIVKAGLVFAQGKGFDVVQIFDSEYSIASILIKLYAKSLSIILMVNAPNFSYDTYVGPWIIKVYKGIQRKFLKSLLGNKIKGVNMLGEFHRTEFRKQFDLSPDFPIAVIYDGADAPKVRLEKIDARRKIGIDYDGTLLLFFGMLRKDKGIEYLIHAVSLVKNLPFKLLIVGSLFDYTEEDIRAIIKKYDVGNKIMTDFNYIDIKDVYNYFFAGDALILPYVKLYAGGSGPLLKEGAVCKVPAIVSNVSEMGPLVQKHNMGFVVEPENASSLADAIKKFLLLSSEERAALGENAFKAANTWAKMGREYEAFYKKISNNFEI